MATCQRWEVRQFLWDSVHGPRRRGERGLGSWLGLQGDMVGRWHGCGINNGVEQDNLSGAVEMVWYLLVAGVVLI
jgi:hypothetical protein